MDLSSHVDRNAPAGWLRCAKRVSCLFLLLLSASALAVLPPYGVHDATPADTFSGLWTPSQSVPDSGVGDALLVLYGHGDSLTGLLVDPHRVRPVRAVRSETPGAFHMSWSQFDSSVQMCARRTGEHLQLWSGVARGWVPGLRGATDCNVPPAEGEQVDWVPLPDAQQVGDQAIAASAWGVRVSDAVSSRITPPADVEPHVPTLRFEATRVRNVVRGVMTTAQGPVEYAGVVYGKRFRLQGITPGHTSTVIAGQAEAGRAEAAWITPRPGSTFGIFQLRRAVRAVRLPDGVAVRPFPVATGRWTLRLHAAPADAPPAELDLYQAGSWVVGRFRDARREWVVGGQLEKGSDDRLTLRANDCPVTVRLRLGVDVLEGELLHADRASEVFTASLRAD